MRVGLVFSALTAAMTYPQLLSMGSQMDGHYDTLFSVWRLAWIAHQLPRDPRHLFDANIFFPQPTALAYSDGLLLQGIGAAPLLWMGVPAIAAYNVLVLVSFVLCGLSMYVCVRALTGSAAGAWFASMAFAFQAYRFGHYGQLETLWAWPIPLAFLALHRLIARPTIRQGLLLGVLVTVQAWSCIYYAVFHHRPPHRRRCARRRPTGPFSDHSRSRSSPLERWGSQSSSAPTVLHLSVAREVGLREEQDVRAWSAIARDYADTPRENWLYGRLTPQRSPETMLFPGLTAMALAAAGLVKRDRRTIAYAILLVVAVDLTFGFSGGVYRVLFETIFVYRGLRVPARLFVLVSTSLAILAGFGVRFVEARAGRWKAGVGAALVGAALLESMTVPLHLRAYISSSPPLYNVLRGLPPGAVIEWPLSRAGSLGQTYDPLYMYLSTFHWHPLANGYSGNYPERFIELLEQMETFPSTTAIAYLRTLPVRYIVLHEGLGEKLDPDFDRLRLALRGRADVGLVYAGSDGMGQAVIFELRSAGEKGVGSRE